MTEKRKGLQVDFEQTEKNIIEVTLGHLARHEEDNDPEAAKEFRRIANRVRAEDPISVEDLQFIWVVLDRKEMVQYPTQPYEEDEAAKDAKDTVEDVVDEIPAHLKEY